MMVIIMNKNYAYVVFRVLVGLLFFQHGAQKLLGWFDGAAAAFPSLFWWAGIIELLGGLAIALGLFTQWVALLAAGEMGVAYVLFHLPQGVVPILNQGEPALLFFAAFLVLATQGTGKWGLR